jgi:hypothetical protein
MEIYADESNERVFVGDGRGPYTVVERDGSTSESFIPRNAKAVYSDAGDIYEAASAGFDDGFTEGRKRGQEEGALAAAQLSRELDAERRHLAARVALRYHPLAVKASRGRP